MNGLDDEPNHATPLDPEEWDGLIPSHITQRHELNELERANILEAYAWAFARRHDPAREAFVRSLHRRMFGAVWRWAGAYRNSNKNTGVEHWQIQPRLYEFLDQMRYWVMHATFCPTELGVRFHHGLVLIHPFPNGNGRWSRLMADILAARLGERPFTWGSGDLSAPDQTRQNYIKALKAADRHDLAPLLAFSRS